MKRENRQAYERRNQNRHKTRKKEGVGLFFVSVWQNAFFSDTLQAIVRARRRARFCGFAAWVFCVFDSVQGRGEERPQGNKGDGKHCQRHGGKDTENPVDNRSACADHADKKESLLQAKRLETLSPPDCHVWKAKSACNAAKRYCCRVRGGNPDRGEDEIRHACSVDKRGGLRIQQEGSFKAGCACGRVGEQYGGCACHRNKQRRYEMPHDLVVLQAFLQRNDIGRVNGHGCKKRNERERL